MSNAHSLLTTEWCFASTRWTFPSPAKIMGILNVTPDSFSDGGRWSLVETAVDHATRMVHGGAAIIDVGGESTRPGALPVEPEEQMRRVLPVIERLKNTVEVPISIDTSSAIVAREALAAGASIVNDVTGLTGDPGLVDVCADSDCGVIIMHMQGTPQTMQVNPHYEDVVREIDAYLSDRVETLAAAGIDRTRIVVDPGIGFGKTAEHNLQLLGNLAGLRSSGRPLLIGHSRKRFLQKVLGRPLEEATAGTIGVAVAVAEQGAELIRVHDVQAVHDAITAWRAVRDARVK